MQSPDDHLISPYSTPSFASSFSAPSADPSAFHRYQHGDLVGPWFAASDPEHHAHHAQGGNLGNSPIEQGFDYQVLGPYMIAQPAMYGQPVAQDSAVLSSQQMQGQFSPGMADSGTPAPSPSNNGVPGVHYRNPSAVSYMPQQSNSAPVPIAYNSPGPMGHLADYSARMEGHRPPTAALYRNSSPKSFDSAASNSYPPASSQTGRQIFTFITPQVGGTASETSSFTSDSGAASQQRSQKAPKKRGTGTATRRPRKPPLEPVAEPKLQTAPEISRNTPRTASPKRAMTEVNQTESRTAFETTPNSSSTVSPGAISKAHIGQRSRAPTDASQQHQATSHVDVSTGQYLGGSQQSPSDNSKFLSQKLKEFIEENQSLNKRADELDKDVQRLKNENAMLSRQAAELKKDVRDMKCKVLESLSGGDAMRDDSPRADGGVPQQMTAYPSDLRRPCTSSIVTSSTASTAISSRRNSPADTVYSNQDGWWHNPLKGGEHSNHPIHSNVYQARQ
ncbi:hypothetical protein CONLIGDRAFT_301253 [Coniochaeta ligniaria NRRL 30616]|uniref:Uncharacterized protein n=1 Tax=Coniochaeta ligniaria NRRL 30616 TaxID=1408157 RepID=A0A1J7IUG0_9PEZI|nr:hypothetical protein CONLIGDRAFT_301253 [Coniochaeta ligniaria NRRL 30616]